MTADTTTDTARREWIAAAPGRGPTRSELREALDALGAELAVLAAAPGRPEDVGSARSKPGSGAPRRTGAAASVRPVEDVLADAATIRAALADAARAWWGSEGAQLARAIEAVRWDLDAARRGRTAAGPPPWHDAAAEAELRAQAEAELPPAPTASGSVTPADGRELCAARKGARLSQDALAARIHAECGFPTAAAAQRAISRLEAGRLDRRDVLDAARRALGSVQTTP